MTPREPDRFDKQARVLMDSECPHERDDYDEIPCVLCLAGFLRAAESSALERAQKKMEGVARVWRPESGVSLLEIVQDVFRALIPPAAAPAAEMGKAQGAEANPHYGRDCPVGMVQVEFVGCPPTARISAYGWKPTVHAFLEIFVDGKRFRIDIGDFHDGYGNRRGLHIITDGLGIAVDKTAMNAASIYFAARAAPSEGEGK